MKKILLMILSGLLLLFANLLNGDFAGLFKDGNCRKSNMYSGWEKPAVPRKGVNW